MMDQEEQNRKQGFAAGTTGEYFRYKHMFWKQPTEKDRDEALGVAAKIRCDVCVAVVESLVQKAAGLSEDHLADALEGNVEYERSGDRVQDRMLEHKKGCNKHFKDELIAEGYSLKSCKEVDPSRSDDDPCLWQNASATPNQMAIDAYEMWKECLFYACEQTVGRWGDSLAEYLADALPGSADRRATIRGACERLAHCRGRPTHVGAAPSPGAAPRKPRRRRRRRGGPGGEL